MIPLAVPDLSGNEKAYLDDCIETTFVSSVGQYVTKFEEMVAGTTGATNAVATSAGTTGLHAALTAAGVGRDDLVILPTFTFIASANAARHCGADPWLMDINVNSWCMEPDLVKAKIEKDCAYAGGKLVHKETGRRVAALMPVYTLGNIPDMEGFRSLADKYELPLVVDAACAIGAVYKGMEFGSLADLSVLSFNGNKTVTCGGGGAVVYDAANAKAKAWGERVRHITTTARIWPDYDFDMTGFNYRMTNLQAAVGVAQMERVESFVGKKRHIRRFYEEALSERLPEGYAFFPATEGSSCWFSGIVLPEGAQLADVKEIVAKLRENGIEARPFWKPVHLQEPYRKVPVSDTETAEGLWQRILTLPCSTGITDEDLGTVADTLAKVLEGGISV